MKGIITLLAMVVMMSLFSCSSENEPVPTPKEDVEFTLNFSTFKSGSMSRSAESAYSEFFQENIATKKLCPANYSITFSGVMTANGAWAGKDIIRLPEGSYGVSGTSYPAIEHNYNFGCDSVYLSFNENVDLTKSTNELMLNANYDCFLLLFNANDIERVQYGNNYSQIGWKDAKKSGNYIYVFLKGTRINGNSTYDLNLKVTKKNGMTDEINTRPLGFEYGKYYYFDTTTASFNISPMIEG